jgi:glyoxylase-like metal-dependent hydrolase (beta-lactamase superfamily II)
MADPTFEQLTPHIYKLNLPFVGGRVPVGLWLVKHDAGWTVVDAGAPGFEDVTLKQILATTGGQPPARLILTHGHVDHGAAAERMVDQWGLPVAAGRLEIPYLLARARYHLVQPSWWGYWLLQRSGPCLIGRNVQLPLDEGMEVDGMRVYHVPGHAPGMVALLHHADRALIAADTFGNLSGKLGEPIRVFTYSPAINRQSMRKLAALDFDHLLPSHGPPLLGDGKARAQAVVEKFKD